MKLSIKKIVILKDIISGIPNILFPLYNNMESNTLMI